ncbi:FadR/GntR family transcriptional regulator [Brucella endophytica]|uniref:FadR/GntR family transcriptional regulator n=1 Tax=Brucella endophytica TaxID=1963359 RepID=UPI001669E9FA|nr:FadR/GntR family transcriptional regulator [Brucella endophytica]
MSAIISGKRRSLAAHVIESLSAEIANGDYAVGDKLPTEPVLVQRFGVSRTVVREAIAALRAEGLVEPRQGAGVFVLASRSNSTVPAIFADVSDRISDIIEELELRIGVEVEAAGLAALRSSPAQEAEIQSRLNHFSELVQAGKSTDDADFQFHLAIASSTNNARFRSFLEHIGRRVIPRVKFRSAMGGQDPLPNRDNILLAEHIKVAAAIFARDAEAARGAMRLHLEGGLKRYRALVRNSSVRLPESY